MNRVYVGLDLGSSNFHQVTISERGVITLSRELATSEANLVKAFSGMRGEILVCSHPQKNAWIARDRDKSDRVDAYKLASLLRLNEFKEIRYPQSQQRSDFKAVVQHYDELTQQQARLKTKVKARLRMQGVITRGELVFSVRGRKAMLAEVKSQVVRRAIQQLYGMLDQSLESQAQARRLMLRTAQALPEIIILRTALAWARSALVVSALTFMRRSGSAPPASFGSIVG